MKLFHPVCVVQFFACIIVLIVHLVLDIFSVVPVLSIALITVSHVTDELSALR